MVLINGAPMQRSVRRGVAAMPAFAGVIRRLKRL
jgi:hypothetical protein